MPDERMESIIQGIAAPPESPTAKRAEEERLARTSKDPPIEGALGGTSDAETAGDEAQLEARLGIWRDPEQDEARRPEERRRNTED